MPTTTNYGWTTPADTDLVKDGAAAIRTLGSSIDTTVFNNANAAVAKTIVDAKGDIIAATAADTLSRLAVGANDTVLTADSSTATGLKWATPASGGMTLLSTTTLSGASTTISGISGSYTHLYAYIYGVTNATADGQLRIRPNGSTTITTSWVQDLATQPTLFQDQFIYAAMLSSGSPQVWTRTSANNGLALSIYNYANTSNWKPFEITGSYTGNNKYVPNSTGAITTSSAITSLEFLNTGGNFSTGTVLLYGVK